MKTLRFIVLFFIALLPLSISAQTFHMIIFADTNDRKIGESTAVDAYNMADVGAVISSAIGMENNTNQLYYIGKDCSTANLMRVLNDIKISKDDIVFFYYSGHGTRSTKDSSKYPQMCMTVNQTEDKFVPLESVDKALAKKNPRFRIVMADCCNSVAEFVTAKENLPQMDLGATQISRAAVSYYKELFCNHTGNIICSASSAGEVAWCLPKAGYGGLFTEYFINLLDVASGEKKLAQWPIIMSKTKDCVIQYSTNNQRIRKQTPVFDVNIDKTSGSIPAASTTPNTNNEILNVLLSLVNHNLSASERISRVAPAYKKYFAGNAMIETVGRNHTTTLDYETAKDFLDRISTSFNLSNFSIVSQDRDEQGKIVRMKIHEIYKER